MTDQDRYPDRLFTRQQIGEMASIDASTLNYWMREGVLRPSEGGRGRGSHRRFPYWEVTLAALLQELRGFGIGMNALAQLAHRFHAAIDWATERGITRSNINRIHSAYLIRSRFIRDGRYTWEVRSSEDQAYFADFEQHTDGRGPPWVELDWEQAIAHWFRPRPRPSDEFTLVPREIELVGSWDSMDDLSTFRRQTDYFHALTSINFREPGAEIQTSPHHFMRNEQGRLVLESDREGAPPASFIGIDLDVLTYHLWVVGGGL
jgi:GNAT superfamily N-acetyltransferase